MDLGTYRVPSAHPLPKLRQRGQGNQLCEGTFEQAGDSTEADWRPLHDRALAELLGERRATLMRKADHCVDQHDNRDDDCVHQMPEQPRSERRRHQEICQGAVELGQEAHDGVNTGGYRQGIGAMAFETLDGFRMGTHPVAIERRQSVFAR